MTPLGSVPGDHRAAVLAFPWGSLPQFATWAIGAAVGLVGWVGWPVWYLVVGRRLRHGAPIGRRRTPDSNVVRREPATVVLVSTCACRREGFGTASAAARSHCAAVRHSRNQNRVRRRLGRDTRIGEVSCASWSSWWSALLRCSRARVPEVRGVLEDRTWVPVPPARRLAPATTLARPSGPTHP